MTRKKFAPRSTWRHMVPTELPRRHICRKSRQVHHRLQSLVYQGDLALPWVFFAPKKNQMAIFWSKCWFLSVLKKTNSQCLACDGSKTDHQETSKLGDHIMLNEYQSSVHSSNSQVHWSKQRFSSLNHVIILMPINSSGNGPMTSLSTKMVEA